MGGSGRQAPNPGALGGPSSLHVPEGPVYPYLPSFSSRKPPPEGWWFPPPIWGRHSIFFCISVAGSSQALKLMPN